MQNFSNQNIPNNPNQSESTKPSNEERYNKFKLQLGASGLLNPGDPEYDQRLQKVAEKLGIIIDSNGNFVSNIEIQSIPATPASTQSASEPTTIEIPPNEAVIENPDLVQHWNILKQRTAARRNPKGGPIPNLKNIKESPELQKALILEATHSPEKQLLLLQHYIATYTKIPFELTLYNQNNQPIKIVAILTIIPEKKVSRTKRTAAHTLPEKYEIELQDSRDETTKKRNTEFFGFYNSKTYQIENIDGLALDEQTIFETILKQNKLETFGSIADKLKLSQNSETMLTEDIAKMRESEAAELKIQEEARKQQQIQYEQKLEKQSQKADKDKINFLEKTELIPNHLIIDIHGFLGALYHPVNRTPLDKIHLNVIDSSVAKTPTGEINKVYRVQCEELGSQVYELPYPSTKKYEEIRGWDKNSLLKSFLRPLGLSESYDKLGPIETTTIKNIHGNKAVELTRIATTPDIDSIIMTIVDDSFIPSGTQKVVQTELSKNELARFYPEGSTGIFTLGRDDQGRLVDLSEIQPLVTSNIEFNERVAIKILKACGFVFKADTGIHARFLNDDDDMKRYTDDYSGLNNDGFVGWDGGSLFGGTDQ
jgi:hypothetical protein